MTTILNLYGGPGTGKSTSAAFLFYLLKTQGANAELAREYVKKWAWENRIPGRYDQSYFLGKQAREESVLYGKVEYIVTDSPVLLSKFYADKYAPERIKEGVTAQVMAHYRQAAEDGHRHLHIFLKRSKPYNPKGRFQNEEEAKAMDEQMDELLFWGRFTTHIIEPNCLLYSGTDEQSLRTIAAKLALEVL
jgi:nicotinamide riboside kinase